MEKNKFNAILVILIPQVVELIAEKCKITNIAATDMLYQSELYALLEQEDTKLWHLSPLMLFTMFDEEQQTGSITFPEEA